MHVVARGDVLEAEAWGPGKEAVLDALPNLVGIGDDRSTFAPLHPLVRRLDRRLEGLRIGRIDGVLEAVIPAVLEQKGHRDRVPARVSQARATVR